MEFNLIFIGKKIDEFFWGGLFWIGKFGCKLEGFFCYDIKWFKIFDVFELGIVVFFVEVEVKVNCYL